MMRETERHPGRPFLDGSPAGTGTRTVTKCVSIPQEMAEYLKVLGDGNLSKGVRVAAEVARYYSTVNIEVVRESTE